MNELHSTLAAVLLALAIQPALAADDDLARRIAACTHEQDDARRLACFDRAAAPKAVAEKATAVEAAPAAASASAAKRDDATRTFGVHGSELARNTDNSAGAQESATPKRITGKVAGIEKRPRGELVISLDNGQVWAQKEAGAYFPLKVGDSVTILAGTLGSFRLVVGSRATAVTRVR